MSENTSPMNMTPVNTPPVNTTPINSALTGPRVKSIFGIAISDLSRDEALTHLHQTILKTRHMKLAFCNAHTANLAWDDASYSEILQRFTVFVDGFGVDIAARVLHGSAFIANLNGTDLVPALLSECDNPLRIALIGGKTGVAESAISKLKDLSPQHLFAPPLHGYASEADQKQFISDLKNQPVDILLVAMGNPKQEIWIAQNITKDHATLVIGVGALFDFLAGNVKRAPLWMRKTRLEWLYRLINEPKRLFRRYVFGNPVFLARIAMVKLGLRQF